MNLSQRGNAKVKVKTICLVLVKMYGNNPKKLLNTIILNKEIKINVDPLILLLAIKTLNSLCKVLIILIQIIFIRDGINQNILGNKSKPKKVLNQFKFKLKFVEGSKELNRLVIIFNSIRFYFYEKYKIWVGI